MCRHNTVISGIAITAAQENGDREPGDFGLDPLDLANKPQEKARYQLNEVKNGRLAMWAAAGMILQGVTTDQSALGNLIVGGFVRVSACRRFLLSMCVCGYRLTGVRVSSSLLRLFSALALVEAIHLVPLKGLEKDRYVARSLTHPTQRIKSNNRCYSSS